MLVFYLIAVGLTEAQTGRLRTLTLLGDTVVSLVIATRADRLGRRRMLVVGALLMSAAGLAFASTTRFWLLLPAATIGVISPSGQEVGPFLPIEQAALTSATTGRTRTELLARYTLTGALATAPGALTAGFLTRAFQQLGSPAVGSYRAVVILYAALGTILAPLFSRLSHCSELIARPEASKAERGTFAGFAGIERSRDVVLKLSSLFALDALVVALSLRVLLPTGFTCDSVPIPRCSGRFSTQASCRLNRSKKSGRQQQAPDICCSRIPECCGRRGLWATTCATRPPTSNRAANASASHVPDDEEMRTSDGIPT